MKKDNVNDVVVTNEMMPANVRCQAIWDLYMYLKNLKRKYVWLKDSRCEKVNQNYRNRYLNELIKDPYRLFYIDSVDFSVGETFYGADCTGIELPIGREEEVILKAVRYDGDTLMSETRTFSVNTVYNTTYTMEKLLERSDLRIPSEQNIADAEMRGFIPVKTEPPVVFPEIFSLSHKPDMYISDWFAKYLVKNHIPYSEDKDGGDIRFTFVFRAENAPGHHVESCVWFRKDGAEVRTYFTELGSNICKKSEHKDELFRLINFINASVYMNICSPKGLYDSQLIYTPRLYMTEDGADDITLMTFINYEFWDKKYSETCDYITAFCPELLDKLTIPIFGVLLGNVTADQAKNYIDANILTES